MDAYLAIIDRTGLRALLSESPEGSLVASEMLCCVPTSMCYWVVVENASAAILRELLDDGEPSLAMRFLQSQAHECGQATLAAPNPDLAA